MSKDHIEISNKTIWSIIIGIVLFGLIIFGARKLNDYREAAKVKSLYQKMETLFQDGSYANDLRKIKSINFKSLDSLNRINADITNELSDIEDSHVYVNVFLKRDGKFYSNENGMTCEDEIRESFISSSKMEDLSRVIQKRKNNFEDAKSLSTTLGYNNYGSMNNMVYFLDFDPEQLAFIAVHCSFY